MLYPEIKLNQRAVRNFISGLIWFKKEDILNFEKEKKEKEKGSLVRILTPEGFFLGIGYFNPESVYSLKVLTQKEEPINKDFFVSRFRECLAFRKTINYAGPMFRLAFSEGDFLPGLIIDVYEKISVIQIHTLGMERLLSEIIEALKEVLEPEGILLKNTSEKRKVEGLKLYTKVVSGRVPEILKIEMDGIKWLIPLKEGQKTGTFLDQRENQRKFRELAKDKVIADLFSYTGGFAFYGLLGGGKLAYLVDSSEFALSVAKETAKINHWEDKIVLVKDDVANFLTYLPEKINLISVDPPAFIKTKKAKFRGKEKYERLYTSLFSVMEEGMVIGSSCSSHLTKRELREIMVNSLSGSGKRGKFFFEGLQAPDHPVNPLIPETLYLKTLGLFLFSH